jgi:hypothetical protein
MRRERSCSDGQSREPRRNTEGATPGPGSYGAKVIWREKNDFRPILQIVQDKILAKDYAALLGLRAVRVFRQEFALDDEIGSHACSLEASMRVSIGTPVGWPLSYRLTL